jgi:hypothetical protein
VTEDESDLEALKFGSVEFQYPRDEPVSPQGDRDLETAVKVAEWMTRLIYSARTERCQHLYASIGIGILKNQLDLEEIATHFSITRERVRQAVKTVKNFQILQRPDP